MKFCSIVLFLIVIGVDSLIDYRQKEWSIPTRIWERINRHEKACENPARENYNGAIEKFVVSTYIARFKYNGTDPRLSTGKNPRNSFQSYFPQPKIDHLDSSIKRACEISSEDCVHHIFLRLKTIPINQNQPKKRNSNQTTITIAYKIKNVDPFLLFLFQTTSMYYLCYWSILIDNSINEIIWPCRNPGKRFANPIWSRCMLEAVCPNPCCGQKNVFSTNDDCTQLPLGICSKYLNNTKSMCKRIEGHDFYSQMSFGYFFANGPQFECDCPPTKTWDSNSLQCLDEDECLRNHSCDSETQYCVNRIQGYFCVCRFGFRMENSGRCTAT